MQSIILYFPLDSECLNLFCFDFVDAKPTLYPVPIFVSDWGDDALGGQGWRRQGEVTLNCTTLFYITVLCGQVGFQEFAALMGATARTYHS